MFAKVDLPEPDLPVNHIQNGCCFFIFDLKYFVTLLTTGKIFSDLRSLKLILPAAITLLVILSININLQNSSIFFFSEKIIGFLV